MGSSKEPRQALMYAHHPCNIYESHVAGMDSHAHISAYSFRHHLPLCVGTRILPQPSPGLDKRVRAMISTDTHVLDGGAYGLYDTITNRCLSKMPVNAVGADSEHAYFSDESGQIYRVALDGSGALEEVRSTWGELAASVRFSVDIGWTTSKRCTANGTSYTACCSIREKTAIIDDDQDKTPWRIPTAWVDVMIAVPEDLLEQVGHLKPKEPPKVLKYLTDPKWLAEVFGSSQPAPTATL